MKKINILIIGSLGIYFGWMLALPLYGPLYMVGLAESYDGQISFSLLFIVAHTLTFFLLGLWLKHLTIWRQMMSISLMMTVIATILLAFNTLMIQNISIVLMGIASSTYILGWSVIYSLSVKRQERVKIMASTIILSNLILMVYYFIRPIINTNNYYLLALVPLIVAIYIQMQLTEISKSESLLNKAPTKPSLPIFRLLLLFIFVFSIYLNGGLMYSVMLPELSSYAYFETYYPFFVYLIILIIIFKFLPDINKSLMIYLGISLLGLSFVSFALLGQFFSGYLITIGLFEASFALLDLFLWTILGFLAYEYGNPFKVFGILLCANTFSIIVGDLMSQYLIRKDENLYMLTAIISSASIFIAILALPWLLSLLHHDNQVATSSNETQIIKLLPSGISLTDREVDVIQLVLKGITNKMIAQELYISEHTVKSHLKNIYNKFGVSGKKELLYLALHEETSP